MNDEAKSIQEEISELLKVAKFRNEHRVKDNDKYIYDLLQLIVHFEKRLIKLLNK